MKSVSKAKNTVIQTKTKVTEREKISFMSDRGLTSKL